MTKVLFLSVGGSPEPLRAAIEAQTWGRVVFVVSDGTASSRPQVEEPEIAYGPDARGPGLRHLPACPRDTGIVAVPPDNLDRALALIDAALVAELARGACVTVNYTGGTKTMSAAMALAGAAHENTRLELIAGTRVGLDRPAPGTERTVEVPGHLLGVANLFALARAFAGRRAYGAAHAVVVDIERLFMRSRTGGLPVPPRSWRQRTETWRAWLSVLDAWDRFDITAAEQGLSRALDVGAPWAMALDQNGDAARLQALWEEKQEGAGPRICEDLWLNAERRAALGLYDDAIARLYRLAEAAVQARLRIGHGIADTGKIPRHLVPDAIAAGGSVKWDHQTGAEVVELSLYRALDLLAHLDPKDALVARWPRNGDRFDIPEWQTNRNRSILAHGLRPATKDDWDAAADWFDERRNVLWEDLMGRTTACQLPDALP